MSLIYLINKIVNILKYKWSKDYYYYYCWKIESWKEQWKSQKAFKKLQKTFSQSFILYDIIMNCQRDILRYYKRKWNILGLKTQDNELVDRESIDDITT